MNIFLERDAGKVILLTNMRTLAGICGLEELAVPWKAEAKNGVGLDKLQKSTQAAWEGPASGTPEGPQGVPGGGQLSSCIYWKPCLPQVLTPCLKTCPGHFHVLESSQGPGRGTATPPNALLFFP